MRHAWEDKAAVIWLTGLSGSGKSTIADRLAAELERLGCEVEKLDGDGVREVFPTGFSREERQQHVRRMGFMAGLLNRHGVFVVASFISPYRESRDFARSHARRFFEVHVSTPLAECERRDVKGLYARARRGEIKAFTGISDPYEPPLCPELTLDTTELPVESAVRQILDAVLGKDQGA
jgi:adenylylsulfate kinase